MNKFYVTKDVAKKLRAKGYYREYDVTDDWVEGIFYQVEDGTFHLPRIDEVLAWLREEKKMHVSIDILGRTWGYDVINLPSGNSLHWTAYDENINNYEQAAISGIEYVIDNLI